LNSLPEVKSFIYGDVPHYDNVEFKPIPGAVPHLLLLNKENQIVERINLEDLNRDECNALLREKGFHRKPAEESKNDEL